MLSCLLTALIACIAAHGQEASGTIEGQVTYKGRPPAEPVVVYVKGSGPRAPSNARAEVEQLNQQFQPRGIVIAAGDTVDFPNRDPYFHNVFSVEPGSEFTLGMYRRGESGSYTFHDPGVVHVYCNEHANMAMEVLVLENAWFATVDAEGRFRIDGVAPGQRTVAVWSPGLEESREADVTVAVGESARVTFDGVRRKGAEPHSRSDGAPYPSYP